MFGIGGDRKVVSLDWDARSLRAVHWRFTKRGPRILRAASARIGPEIDCKDADSMGAFLGRVLLQQGIHTHSVIADIPRDQAVLNTMSLPAVAADDLAGMVQLQIAKELPFPLEQAVVDFAVSEQQADPSTVDVLVAAVRRQVLDFYKEVADRAGLKLERVGLRPYANMVAINDGLGKAVAGRVLFVDIGPSLTEIGILRDGALVFSRAASVQLTPEPDVARDRIAAVSDTAILAEPEDPERQRAIEGLLVEITRSAEAYRSTDPGAQFANVVVAGNSGLEAGLAKALSKRFDVHAELFKPSTRFRLESVNPEDVTSFAAAIGLGLGHAEEGLLQFDFLHPKKPLDAAARRRRKLSWAGAGAVTLGLAAAIAYFVGIYPVQSELKVLKAEVAQLKVQSAKYKQVHKLVRQAQQWQSQQVVWPVELKLLAEVLDSVEPQNGYLENLDLNGSNGRILFEIVAANREVITQLKRKLNTIQPEGHAQPIFRALAGSIRKQLKDRKYPVHTRMTVVLRRLEES